MNLCKTLANIFAPPTFNELTKFAKTTKIK